MTYRTRTASCLVLTLCLLREVTGFPNGAPTESCRNLLPNHKDGEIQKTRSPYGVLPVAGEGRVRLTLGSPEGRAYQGFLIVARDVESGENVGTFVDIPNSAQAIQCVPDATTGNAVTHMSNEKKHNLEFDWESPANYVGTIVFNSTFLENYSTYWVGVESPRVRVNRRSIEVLSLPLASPFTSTPVPTIIPSRLPSTPPYFAPTSTADDDYDEGNKENSLFYSECGTTKNCFGVPSGCLEEKSCTAVVSIVVKGDRYLFELRARTGRYVAVGLSDDSKMGNDSVVECANEGDRIGLYASWNSGKKNSRIQMQEGAIQLDSSSLKDDTIMCKFWREKTTTVEGQEFNLVKRPYNLLLAVGSQLKGNGVGFHDIDYAATAEAKFLSDVSGYRVANNLLVRLHGALMLASWIGTASIGILLARYYRQTWLASQLCGKDHWFVWHRSFMLLTWTMTVASFVIIFVELGEWSVETIHASFGLATTILCFVQPFMAAIRPHPAAPRRQLFNWIHWFVGNAAHICGIIAIFFAVRLNKAKLPEWVDWMLVAYVGSYIVVHLVLTSVGCASDRRAGQRVSSFPMKDVHSRGPIGHSDARRDAPHSRIRRVLFGVYSVVTVLLTVALIVITVLAPIEESWRSFRSAISTY